jgi:hypothetical protein
LSLQIQTCLTTESVCSSTLSGTGLLTERNSRQSPIVVLPYRLSSQRRRSSRRRRRRRP